MRYTPVVNSPMPSPITTADADLLSLTLAEVSALIREKRVSPVDLTNACLRRIEALDPQLNAFITVTPELALEMARVAEAEISRGEWRGPLHGVPIALKDIIDTAGVRTTAASALFSERIPNHDAFIVRRLKEAGAVIIGKTNLHEFAYGGSGLIGHFGITRNPVAPEYIAGGSSSGSAAAVAAGMCFAAIGTDTAGSIRLPASFCGVAGLKPTFGLVSTRGVIPLSWSLDHVGPMARSVHDCATVLAAIRGHDSSDPNSREYAIDRRGRIRTKGLRLGVARTFFFDDLDPEVAKVTDYALKRASRLAESMDEVDVPVSTDAAVRQAETYAYHAKFVAESPDGYDPETLRRINEGAKFTASDYILALRRLQELRHTSTALFEKINLVLTPTTPVLPQRIADLQGGPGLLRTREMVMLRNTRPFNVLGWPVVSIPCGFSRTGLPVGLQIVGAPGQDHVVLAFAAALERKFGQKRRDPAAQPSA